MSANLTLEHRQHRGDSAGLIISGLCLLHCLAAPLIAALIPAMALALSREADLLIHWSLLGLAVPVSLWTFRQGIRQHGQRRCLMIGGLGLMLMLIGVLIESFAHIHTHTHHAHSGFTPEVMVTIVGVVLVATAHLLNWVTTMRATGIWGNSVHACGPICHHESRSSESH